MGLMSFLKEIGFDTFLDFLGFVSNICYVLTPILYNLLFDYNTFEIESISILAVFSMYCNAFIYFFLGLFGESSGNSFVLRDYCNLIGTFLGLVYLAIYFYERYKDESIKKLILNYLFKWIGVFPNVLEYFPIGLNICYLIKNKKAKKFLVVGGTFGLINSIVWFIWAIHFTITHKEEPQYHSICANFLSISMIFLQFFIFCKYYNKNEKVYHSFGKNKYD